MTDPFARYRQDHPQRFASPDRIAQLASERFRPWPLPQLRLPRHPHASPTATPASSTHARQGFVRDSRFGSGLVIPGTNRAKQRNEARKAREGRK